MDKPIGEGDKEFLLLVMMLWIVINAIGVSKITIGDDVMIALNSYVNCDVPSHSIAIGNPCVIKHRENATEGYIDRKV